MSAVVFFGVEGLLIWFTLKFKARRGRVAAQIRGNTRLEVGWTIGAAVILVVLAVITFLMLPGIREPANSDARGLRADNGILYAGGPVERLPPNGRSLQVCVNGQQYIW